MAKRAIFSVCPEAEFFGRDPLIDHIVDHVVNPSPLAPNMLLVGRRWRGKTEVLRRVHAILFREHTAVVPIYFRIRRYDVLTDLADDFIREVAKQYAAFRTRDEAFATEEITLERLEKELIDSDPAGVVRFLRSHREARERDPISALRGSLAVPGAISRSSGVPLFLIIDDIGRVAEVTGPGGRQVLEDLVYALATGPSRFLASSDSVSCLENTGGADTEVVNMGGLDEETAIFMLAELCRVNRVRFDAEVLRQLARKLDGCPLYLKNMVRAARRVGSGLADMKETASIYVQEITSGNIAFALRGELQLRGKDELRCARAVASADKKRNPHIPVTVEGLEEMLLLEAGSLAAPVERLVQARLVDNSLGTLTWTGDSAEGDFIDYMCDVSVGSRTPEEARTSMVRNFLKETYSLRGVSGSLASGGFTKDVTRVIESFDGQKVPFKLFSNRGFPGGEKNGISKSGSDESRRAGEGDTELPIVIGSFDSHRFEKNETGPAILLARGFMGGRYDTSAEVVWAVGVKEGVNPVNVGDVANFTRRLSLLRENFRTTRMVKWITSGVGFTGEALDMAFKEGILTSGPKELRALGDLFTCAGKPPAGELRAVIPDKEFEVTLPSTSKAELVAARAVEEITVDMGFDERSIGGIKTAVVEACINAFEHGKPSTGKVHIRFITSPGRLEVRVENTGTNYLGHAETRRALEGEDREKLPRKRGWGLELIRRLMDEVRFESIPGGTRVVMVKYLIKEGEPGE